MTASRLIRKVKEVGGDERPVNFTGYGGQWMKKEGFESTIELDMDMFLDKTFAPFRKQKTHRENMYFRHNPWYLTNKHQNRNNQFISDEFDAQEVTKRIYQSRPDLILSIDNEGLTFMLMEEIKSYYANSALDCPKRHYMNRFVKDFHQWQMKYVDHMHYTLPL